MNGQREMMAKPSQLQQPWVDPAQAGDTHGKRKKRATDPERIAAIGYAKSVPVLQSVSTEIKCMTRLK